jgi:hypothetical protein
LASEAKRLKKAAWQLNKKLRLERKLSAKMRRFLRKQNKMFLEAYEKLGITLDAQQTAPELQAILGEHYAKVAKVFAPVALEELNEELSKAGLDRVDSKDPAILSALLFFAALAIRDSVPRITATSNKEIDKALIDSDGDGRQAYRALQARNIPRSNTIAMTETQKAAEGAKQTAAETAGEVVAATTLAAVSVEQYKVWMTQGDKKVRSAHALVNFQEAPLNDPFIVGGELLMFPGDSSLGASSWNTINCRCISLQESRVVVL